MTNKDPLPLLPLKDNLLLIPLPESKKEQVTEGGIVVPDAKMKHPYKKGIVLLKGPGMTTEMDNGMSQIPEEINVGDIVLYHQAAGWDIEVSKTMYTIVSWRQVETMINPDFAKQVNKTDQA